MAKKVRFEDLILFEDKDYIVINKPAGFASLDDRHEAPSVLDLARDYTPDAQLAHRLDKETSGALAIAKNPEAYREISIQFEDRIITKVYHAIVDGIHPFKGEEVNLPIHASARGGVRIDFEEGKIAQTFVTTVEAFRQHSLVECVPITGRMHQIRIHLASLKAPIVGDSAYGGKPLMLSEFKRNFNLKRDTEELPIIRRVGLHARALSFHAMNEEEVTVMADYPKDFAVALKQLAKYR
ncbi:MAG TPA: RNA pseudouridine synthase [Cytophagales bacterium]|nr:RNA pseudouridine synthase [Cytophagales bacterium]HAA23345.1 RNA pseudouridine synthase [Cytophagales bacterium]HAP65015.1 RNA pseudouridine synthase [Cytophagales bacterium]